jgi:hypothetical protein
MKDIQRMGVFQAMNNIAESLYQIYSGLSADRLVVWRLVDEMTGGRFRVGD